MKAKEYPQDDKKQPSHRSQVIPFLIVVAILILLISILGPPPGKGDLQLIDGAQDEFECVYYVDGKQSETPVRRVISNNVSPYYVDGQVIVTGSIKAINDVRAELEEERQILLEPLELCDVRYPGINTQGTTQTRSLVSAPQAFVLLQVVDGETENAVDNAVAAINAAGNASDVFASPNYLTGPLADPVAGSPCASPFEVGGSPFEVGGSPFEVGGSPAGSALAEADADTFWLQRVFSETNILPAHHLQNDSIRVAVFDTIPKGSECDCDCDCNRTIDHNVNNVMETDVNGDGQDDTQKFQIHIYPTSQANDLQPVDPNSVDVSDHGAFVAGLINAVSGVGEIDLYQVLNGAGCGDLQGLNKALNDYSSRILSTNDGSMQNVVINLSLGVHEPLDWEKRGLPEEIFVLKQTMEQAAQNGAVIVAAAGNNSAELPGPSFSDQPASYEDVLGVAAINNDDERSCYSNRGEFAAPAGDGGPFTELPPEVQTAILEAEAQPDYSGPIISDRTCLPLAILCNPTNLVCQYGVVSYSPSSKTRYRFWAGTSFAAPLFSGIAVLMLDDGHRPENIQSALSGWVVSPSAAPGSESETGPGILQTIDTLPTPMP